MGESLRLCRLAQRESGLNPYVREANCAACSQADDGQSLVSAIINVELRHRLVGLWRRDTTDQHVLLALKLKQRLGVEKAARALAAAIRAGLPEQEALDAAREIGIDLDAEL